MENVQEKDNERTCYENKMQDCEIVWCVGDKCLAPWTPDGQFYKGTVRQLQHCRSGRVLALVNFDNFDSEDSEEYDVKVLRKVPRQPNKIKTNASDIPLENSGIFHPFTGSEETARLNEKYQYESPEDDVVSKDRLSPPLPGAQGKVPKWKMKSPVKSPQASWQKRKAGVLAVGGSPQKKRNQKGVSCLTSEKNVRNITVTSKMVAEKDNTSKMVAEKDNQAAETRCEESRDSQNASCSEVHEKVPGQLGAIQGTGSQIKDADGSTFLEGFADEDMEKPKFTFPAPSAKVPFPLSEADGCDVQIPAPLNQYLRDYQREGIQFLYSHYLCNRGAILGDDMGLGKTVQVIGFLSALMGKRGNREDVMGQRPRFIREMSGADISEGRKCRPFLIVGPGSVLYNWLEELETWAYFTARKFHGPDKAACLADILRGRVEVVVTTFETCRDSVEDLNRVKWEAIIVDEVHRIKGLKAQTTQALRKIKCKRRYGLTGTALQNNMSELWCILDWCQPNVLGSAEEFEENFVHPIEQGQRQNATKRELAEARLKKEEFAAVRSRMLLRRTKKLLAGQLPIKTDRVVFCRLSPLQVSVYSAVLAHPHMKHILHADDPCPCGSGQTRSRCCFKRLPDGRSPRSAMFTFMHVLLKASNHVALLTPHARMNPDQERQARALCDLAFKDHPEFLGLTREAAFRTLSDPQYCGKMKVLQGLLSVFAKTHSKVLIFSYSTRLLDILEQYIMSVGHEYRRIDGTVAGRRRQQIVKEFNTNSDIFLCLVSTKAGGLGLNMTGANKVVIFDPNWNPSLDLQAQDRAYRIGQRRDVEVYRLISAGSIEENIYLRQIYKQQLDVVAIGTENARRYFQGIQGDADNKGELFGVKNMFQLRTGDSCLTMDILKRNATVEAGIAGYDMADYMPATREQGSAKTNSSCSESEDDEAAERYQSSSSEEESLEIFKNLFDDRALDDEILNGQPCPSTSGPRGCRGKMKSTVIHPRESTEVIHGRESAESDAPRNESKSLSSENGSSKRQKTDSDIGISKRTRLVMFGSESESDSDASAVRHVMRLRKKKKNEKQTKEPSDKNTEGGVFDFLQDCRGASAGKRKVPVVKGQKDKGKRLKKSIRPLPGNGNSDFPSFPSVNAVFAACGVVHVHDNPRVVGASRVEDHMTRCAMEDVFELSANTQDPAMLCGPMSQDEGEKTTSEKKKAKRGKTPAKDHNSAQTVDHGPWHIIVGQTPVAIKRKHWQHLKEKMKKPDDVALAVLVLQSSTDERLALLRDLYKERHDHTLHDVLDGVVQRQLSPAAEVAVATPASKGTRKPFIPASAKRGSLKATAARKKPKQPPPGNKRLAKGPVYDTDSSSDGEDLQQFSRRNSARDTAFNVRSGYKSCLKVSPAQPKVLPRSRRSLARKGQSLKCIVKAKSSMTSDPLAACEDSVGRALERLTKPPETKASAVLKPESILDIFDDTSDVIDVPSLPVDVDVLVAEMGGKTSSSKSKPEIILRKDRNLNKNVFMNMEQFETVNRKMDQKSASTDNFNKDKGTSVLDDIFSDPENAAGVRRKPPPGKTAKETVQPGSVGVRHHATDRKDIAALAQTRRTSRHVSAGLCESGTSGDSNLKPPRCQTEKRVAEIPSPLPSPSPAEVLSSLFNESTLKEDFLGDPSQWKKCRKIPKPPLKKIDRIAQEAKEDYLQMFESGRLVSKRQRALVEHEREKDDKINENTKESSELDPSASLF